MQAEMRYTTFVVGILVGMTTSLGISTAFTLQDLSKDILLEPTPFHSRAVWCLPACTYRSVRTYVCIERLLWLDSLSLNSTYDSDRFFPVCVCLENA